MPGLIIGSPTLCSASTVPYWVVPSCWALHPLQHQIFWGAAGCNGGCPNIPQIIPSQTKTSKAFGTCLAPWYRVAVTFWAGFHLGCASPVSTKIGSMLRAPNHWISDIPCMVSFSIFKVGCTSTTSPSNSGGNSWAPTDWTDGRVRALGRLYNHNSYISPYLFDSFWGVPFSFFKENKRDRWRMQPCF